MKTFLDCVPCFLRQTLAASRMATDNLETQEKILREVLTMAAGLSFSRTPVHMGRDIHRVIKKFSGNADPYWAAKQHFNDEVLKLYPELKQKVKASDHPFATAVRLAIAGNIIDLGIKMTKDDINLQETIADTLAQPFAINRLAELENAIKTARSIMYLGDNAGEIVFDRILIEELPRDKIIFAVKSLPIINDATLEDAREVGLTEIVKVIENGSDAPGTILEDCTEEFQKLFAQADLVIAKGQGNYETLNDVKRANVFFLLKAKCPVLARDLGCEIGSIIATCNNANDLKAGKTRVGNVKR
ncbi:MAG: DUF89 family protein [Planctomycetes bacterium]|nr:DUF89 family protein [Planctomycetota bacterium]